MKRFAAAMVGVAGLALLVLSTASAGSIRPDGGTSGLAVRPSLSATLHSPARSQAVRTPPTRALKHLQAAVNRGKQRGLASVGANAVAPDAVGQCFWQNSNGLDYCWHHWYSDSTWELFHLYAYYADQFLDQNWGLAYYYPWGQWFAYCVSGGGILYWC